MAKPQTVKIPISDDKKGEIGWPVDQPLEVTVANRRIAVVQQSRSPLHGELVYRGQQFFTLDGIVAMMAEQIRLEELDYHKMAQYRWIMTDVARRLAEVDGAQATSQQHGRINAVDRGIGSGVRSLEKIDAKHHAQSATKAATTEESSRQAGLTVLDLIDRGQIAGAIGGIARADQRSILEVVRVFTKRANQTVELLRGEQDPERLHRDFELLAPGFYKPWTFWRRVDDNLRWAGYRLHHSDYAPRLADCLELDGSMFWLSAPLRRLQYDSQARLEASWQNLISRLTRRMRYLRSFNNLLGPYYYLVLDLMNSLDDCRNQLLAGNGSQAKQVAAEANRLMRYRRTGDPVWYAGYPVPVQ